MTRKLRFSRVGLGRASRVTQGPVGWALEVKGMYFPG